MHVLQRNVVVDVLHNVETPFNIVLMQIIIYYVVGYIINNNNYNKYYSYTTR